VNITAQIIGETTTINLTQAEAVVLFEFLSRFDENDQLGIYDKAEELVLRNILGAFERVLVEPFAADYLEKLEAARETVRLSG
jgi:hypothetical protein